MMNKDEHDPLQPHTHEPNPEPPSDDPTIRLVFPAGRQQEITLGNLSELPKTSIHDCYIVSTGHGTSGPFTFTGVSLLDFCQAFIADHWTQLEIISGDGFGNRVFRNEVETPSGQGPILLAYEIDGRPLTRQTGLVRLIVPNERDDALRQVKWVSNIRIRP